GFGEPRAKLAQALLFDVGNDAMTIRANVDQERHTSHNAVGQEADELIARHHLGVGDGFGIVTPSAGLHGDALVADDVAADRASGFARALFLNDVAHPSIAQI